MIIGIILRAIFFYFVWQLGRRLWATYVAGKSPKHSSNIHGRSRNKAEKGDVFDADFRVLNDQD